MTDYERFLKGSFIESLPITEITDEDIDQFFLEIIRSAKGRNGRAGIDYKSFGKLYGYMEGTFGFAFRKHMIHENPMSRLAKKDYRNICLEPEEKTAETELISDECFDQILEQLYEDMKNNPTCFATYAVELSAKLGTRVGEIAALKWKDVDYSAGYITIRRSDRYKKQRDEKGNIIKTEWVVEERTKTKKQRRFPIDDEIRKSLDRIHDVQAKYGLTSEWVFPHPDYGWTHSSIISSCLKNKCKQLGFDRTYGVHAFRKTLNSDMRHDNVSVQMCASMIGNTEEVNNLHYTYDISRMDEKREAVEKAHAKRAYK